MARPFESMKPALTRLGPPPEAARREVLFIHGAWGGAWVWDGLAQAVAAAGYGVNLMEQPGHGADRWDLPSLTSINDYAGLSRRAAASLGRPVLVGHSLGGWQVQKIWQTEDLPGVLLAPLPGSGLPPLRFLRMLLSHFPEMAGALLGRPVRIRDKAMARRLFFRDADEAVVAAHLARLAPEPALVCLQLALSLPLGLGRPHPRFGREPRLLVAGTADYFIPPQRQRALAQRLGARYELLENAPHDLWLEDPRGRVRALLLEFLAGLD